MKLRIAIKQHNITQIRKIANGSDCGCCAYSCRIE